LTARKARVMHVSDIMKKNKLRRKGAVLGEKTLPGCTTGQGNASRNRKKKRRKRPESNYEKCMLRRGGIPKERALLERR